MGSWSSAGTYDLEHQMWVLGVGDKGQGYTAAATFAGLKSAMDYVNRWWPHRSTWLTPDPETSELVKLGGLPEDHNPHELVCEAVDGLPGGNALHLELVPFNPQTWHRHQPRADLLPTTATSGPHGGQEEIPDRVIG